LLIDTALKKTKMANKIETIKSCLLALSEEAKSAILAGNEFNLSDDMKLSVELLKKEREDKEAAFIVEREKLYHEHRVAHADCWCAFYTTLYAAGGVYALSFIPWELPAVILQLTWCCGMYLFSVDRKHSTNRIFSRHSEIADYKTRLAMLKRDVKNSYSMFGTRIVAIKYFD